MTPTPLLLPASLAAIALATLAAPALGAPKTRTCDAVTVTVSGAHRTAQGIRATGVACAQARPVVRACLRDDLRGWRVSHAPSLDDRNPRGLVGLDRRSAHVSFQIRGRGGCG